MNNFTATLPMDQDAPARALGRLVLVALLLLMLAQPSLAAEVTVSDGDPATTTDETGAPEPGGDASSHDDWNWGAAALGELSGDRPSGGHAFQYLRSGDGPCSCGTGTRRGRFRVRGSCGCYTGPGYIGGGASFAFGGPRSTGGAGGGGGGGSGAGFDDTTRVVTTTTNTVTPPTGGGNTGGGSTGGTSGVQRFIEVDFWRESGDRLITRDRLTGLDWLDVNATSLRGSSYDGVAGGAGRWIDRNFRYATATEVAELFGLTQLDANGVALQDLEGAAALLTMLSCGATCNADAHRDGAVIGALFDTDPFSSQQAWLAQLQLGGSGELFGSQALMARLTFDLIAKNLGDAHIGSLLVRPIPTPIPPAGLLFLAPAALLGYRLRRHAR